MQLKKKKQRRKKPGVGHSKQLHGVAQAFACLTGLDVNTIVHGLNMTGQTRTEYVTNVIISKGETMPVLFIPGVSWSVIVVMKTINSFGFYLQKKSFILCHGQKMYDNCQDGTYLVKCTYRQEFQRADGPDELLSCRLEPVGTQHVVVFKNGLVYHEDGVLTAEEAFKRRTGLIQQTGQVGCLDR